MRPLAYVRKVSNSERLGGGARRVRATAKRHKQRVGTVDRLSGVTARATETHVPGAYPGDCARHPQDNASCVRRGRITRAEFMNIRTMFAAAAGRSSRAGAWCPGGIGDRARIGNRSSRGDGACGRDERARLLDVGRPIAIGEKAVIADTGEALRDDVQKEAAKELHGRELYPLPGVAVAVIPILECDALAVQGGDAAVPDRDSVCVGSQIAWRAAEEQSKTGDERDIRAHGALGEIANAHRLPHPLTQGSGGYASASRDRESALGALIVETLRVHIAVRTLLGYDGDFPRDAATCVEVRRLAEIPEAPFR